MAKKRKNERKNENINKQVQRRAATETAAFIRVVLYNDESSVVERCPNGQNRR